VNVHVERLPPLVVADHVGPFPGEGERNGPADVAACSRDQDCPAADGYASGRIPEVKAGLLLVKNMSLIGLQISDYRDRTPDKVRRAQAQLFDLNDASKLKPHIMAEYSLNQYRDALGQVADARCSATFC
jgi:hypothetical protein